MKKVCWLVAAAVAAATASVPVPAQEPTTVSGRVTNAQGAAENAVTVRINALNVGTTTSVDGTYRLVIPASRLRAAQQVTITASRVGLASSTRTITISPGNALTQNFQLGSQTVALEGLVVTALGITREERAIPQAVTQLSGDELSRVETNVVNTLAGKVSGVQITNAGPQGGSSRVVIRGASSLQGNNQPLFVVDGVPIDNSAPRLYGYGGRDYGNAAQDIDPANIESLTVLKGPNAAALYGTRAANGAIIITTKSGRSARAGGQFTISQQLTTESPLMLPDYQDVYGQGLNGKFAYVDGNGAGTFDDYDESWGPKLDGRMIAQYNSPIVNGVRQPLPWVARPNNIRGFYERGVTSNTNASFAASGDRANVRLSLSYLDQGGMLPGQEMDVTTVGMNGGLNVNNRMSVTTTLQFIGRDAANRPGIGYAESNPMEQFIWFGRQVDLADLRRNARTVRGDDDPMAGRPYSWNYSFHPNPYFLQLVNSNKDTRDRLIGNVALNYKFTDWLTALVRGGTDWYQEDRRESYAAGNYGISSVDPLDASDLTVGDRGAFGQHQQSFQETNADFLLTAVPRLAERFSLTASVGGNSRFVRRQEDYVWVSELSAPGTFSVSNAATTPKTSDYLRRKQINSLYGQAEFGYDDVFFLTFTGRNDWSSSLPESSRSYFYPSISGALVFTDAVPSLDMGGVLNYGKVRASWARVGNDASEYQLRDIYTANTPFGSFPQFTLPASIRNPGLRPESTDAFEVGTDLRFAQNRVNLDLTYYQKTTTDQILPVQMSRATGFSSAIINAGTVRNRGVEAGLTLVPFQRANGFRWESTLTFGKNDNRVVELAEGIETLDLGSFWGLTVQARAGEPYGQLVGHGYLRDSQGRPVVSSQGRPQFDPTVRVLGNYNPDWTGGWSNTFGFRNVSLSFLLDTKQGGEIYSVSHQWGTYAGVLGETVAGRCRLTASYAEDLPACGPGTGILVPNSVFVTAAGDTVPNTDRYTSAQRYWKDLYENHEAHIVDASFVKLREVTLGYNLPQAFSRRMGLKEMNIALTGRNLALWSKAPNIDPETAFDASNVQGLEFGQIPSARSIGFNITVTP
jgi:TonB-linked SusC/RagA family outer membrane protein